VTPVVLEPDQLRLEAEPGRYRPAISSKETPVAEDLSEPLSLDCAACGFVYDEDRAEAAATAIVQGAQAIASTLLEAGAEVARRPQPATWSILEYGCHVRDVLAVQRERVLLARRSSGPPSPPQMGREERVEHDGYAQQAPGDVARQLQDAALLLANVLDRLDESSWNRTIMYNYPTRSERRLRWVAVHAVHEIQHHLQDVRRASLSVTSATGPPGR
jgi:hypothetical protein